MVYDNVLVVAAPQATVISLVAANVATVGVVAPIVLDLLIIHPLASVIFTEYTPGTNPVRS